MATVDLLTYRQKLVLDDKQFNTGMTNAQSKFGKVTGVLGSIGGTVTKAIGTAVAASSAALGGLGAIGLKYNSEMEDYTTNFKVMLGSQEKALQKVEELKIMAAKTPFEMTDLADATQTLLSFGIDSNKASKYLQQIGDISLGNRDKFKSLSLAFAQVQSTGKLTGQDLLKFVA